MTTIRQSYAPESSFLERGTPNLVPAGTRVYAVGDIHGRRDLLDRLATLIEADSGTAADRRVLLFLGDYVDRGPDSKAVIERMVQSFAGYDVHCLRGNHDQMMLDFLESPASYRAWRAVGGLETLRSYGIIPPRLENETIAGELQRAFIAAVPPAHVEFLKGLSDFVAIGRYFFAHAGVRPAVTLDRQDPNDLIWIRDEFLASGADHGKIVVHGHSPTLEPELRANRIGIDTGAYATGRLTAAVLEQSGCRFLHT